MKNLTPAISLAVGLSLLAIAPIRAADPAINPSDVPAGNPNAAPQPVPTPTPAGNNAKGTDQTDNNYYWQGTQLYNLGRLGEAFDSFEKAIQRKQNSKEAEAYLLQIRQEIVTNAKKRAEERSTLNYSGNTPDSALNVQYVQKGYVKVILQAKFLFDENSASLKTSSLDVLNRLADIIQTKEGNRVELVMLDELDATAQAKDIDAQRALLVFAYINFKKLSSGSGNSAPTAS